MTRAALALVLAACGSSPDAPVDAAPATDAPADAIACGTRAGARGLSMRQQTVSGLQRTYRVYLPPGSPAERMPLVYVHHGYTMSGQKMVDITAYTALADTEKVALAFPDGQGGPDTFTAPWNVGTNLCASTSGAPPSAPGDDFAFLEAMAADISADQCLDTEHVFVTGFSMGGYFSHHAGCMVPGVRAVAPHSGGTHELSGCVNDRRPIIMFHGTSDSIIPASCSDSAATDWAAHNGCATTFTTRTVQGGTCRRWDGCPTGGQVELCTFDNMAHCWAGGVQGAGIFSCPTYASATQLAWQFWKTYAWD
ncbi:MAG: dienelactone hydrolase family protein [Myxococcales bacterium]|nr:dienelactone hydrolase family protein [Myxococcales bacterium]